MAQSGRGGLVGFLMVIIAGLWPSAAMAQLVITEFAVPTAASQPALIAAGPDGNLWFTEGSGNKIGRITPAGVITEFPIPTAASRPNKIEPGPDGNLWFTEYNTNKIGRITPGGANTITEFLVPTSSSGPNDLRAGPDGNMWFTE